MQSVHFLRLPRTPRASALQASGEQIQIHGQARWLSGRASDSWSEGRGFESRPSSHFDSPTGRVQMSFFAAALWNPRLISVETGIIIMIPQKKLWSAWILRYIRPIIIIIIIKCAVKFARIGQCIWGVLEDLELSWVEKLVWKCTKNLFVFRSMYFNHKSAPFR